MMIMPLTYKYLKIYIKEIPVYDQTNNKDSQPHGCSTGDFGHVVLKDPA
jgi:hypothetical protein